MTYAQLEALRFIATSFGVGCVLGLLVGIARGMRA